MIKSLFFIFYYVNNSFCYIHQIFQELANGNPRYAVVDSDISQDPDPDLSHMELDPVAIYAKPLPKSERSAFKSILKKRDRDREEGDGESDPCEMMDHTGAMMDHPGQMIDHADPMMDSYLETDMDSLRRGPPTLPKPAAAPALLTLDVTQIPPASSHLSLLPSSPPYKHHPIPNSISSPLSLDMSQHQGSPYRNPDLVNSDIKRIRQATQV